MQSRFSHEAAQVLMLNGAVCQCLLIFKVDLWVFKSPWSRRGTLKVHFVFKILKNEYKSYCSGVHSLYV